MNCYPSLSPEHIEINAELTKLFTDISDHYTCISGYDYTNGSFRGATYVSAILTISGENIMKCGSNLPKILEALLKLWDRVHEPEWQLYYKREYSMYPNYPVVLTISDNLPGGRKSGEYFSSVKELEFMIMVFDIYVKHNLYLLSSG